MIIQRPFQAEDLKWLVKNGHSDMVISDEQAEIAQKNARYAYTWLDGKTGEVLLCAGINEYWTNRGEAWALFNRNAGKQLLGLTRRVQKFFQEECKTRRVEAAVRLGFSRGIQWAALLGFQCESPRAKAYYPDGQDVSLWARVTG